MKNSYKKIYLNYYAKHYRQGITIIELLITLTVLGIIIAVVTTKFGEIRENQVLKNGVQNILSSIDKARAQTLASLNSSQYGIHFQNDKIIIFTGTVFNPVATSNENIDITTPASITNVNIGGVNGASGEFYFTRLSGNPNTTASVTISTTNYSKIITISATGTASVN